MAKQKNLESKVVPVYSWNSFDELVDEIAKEDKKIGKVVRENNFYRERLKEIAVDMNRKYKGPIYFGKIIDKWDRVTSSVGMVAELMPGTGTLVSALEEIPELIPKAVYAVYYVNKTGDWKAIPYWTAVEAASFLPFGVGDIVDWTNVYFNRARKKMKDAVKKKFKDEVEISQDKRTKSAA
ncbi:hypothetical protein J4477_01830 [Candidatus Pacearchaeota archaeon]|nr:hypothetical protein [Candidatus Pacearchaeota archaeon]